MKEQINFTYERFRNIDELVPEDAALLNEARKVTEKAYAKYSHFNVGAVAMMNNGEKVYGTNQENASYPVGICAERVLLASASMLQQDEPIKTLAISYHNQSENGSSNQPVSPCGMCRQSLAEYEDRVQQPIRIILSGMAGEVIVINTAKDLLPLSFSSNDMALRESI